MTGHGRDKEPIAKDDHEVWSGLLQGSGSDGPMWLRTLSPLEQTYRSLTRGLQISDQKGHVTHVSGVTSFVDDVALFEGDILGDPLEKGRQCMDLWGRLL